MFNFYIQRHANIKDDVLSGLTVALALIPEAVAFSFVAGVEPLVGLYAAFIVGLITAVGGGRPGMISGATGALAVVMIELVAQHGVEYLFAAVRCIRAGPRIRSDGVYRPCHCSSGRSNRICPGLCVEKR
jgi:SulP family sulfate permease